ncbi:HlyD family secretion protein [Salinisphaera aquimarina]
MGIVLRVAATLLVLAVAGVLAWAAWQHYVYAPWTRDARVQANIINIAPEVSGTVAEVAVADDGYVKRGDLLFRIEPVRFQNALIAAKASLRQAQAQQNFDARDARRLSSLPRGAVSNEDVQRAHAQAEASAAAVAQAQARVTQAQQDIEWATVRSPVNGYVTHLLLNEGDYAAEGSEVLTLVDADTFRVTAYFEETKLPHIQIGDRAEIRLMAGNGKFSGHVSSITRGIAVPNNAPGEQNLASVNPTFEWVRLAQRVPVTIRFDRDPRQLPLSVGLTATVHIRDDTETDDAADDDTLPHDGLVPPPEDVESSAAQAPAAQRLTRSGKIGTGA